MIDTNIIIDSLNYTVSGGGYHINWGAMWGNYLGWYLAGLVATFLYFWFIIRGGTAEEDTFKEFFSIRANQNKVYLHLVLYTAYVLIWIYEGGGASISLIGGVVASVISIVGVDLTKTVVDVSRQIDSAMPKGELNIWAMVVGASITFMVRNVLPAIWRKAKLIWTEKKI